jgi:sugar transferase (PEP-CTERM/EpsH1 system associated)
MINVQHVVLSLRPGGLENGVVNLINRLDPNEFKSSVCCLKEAGEFALRLENERTCVFEMGWSGGNDLRLLFRMVSLFRRTKPDIVHTRNAEAFFYGFLAAKIAGVRTIVHSEHGRTFDDRGIRFLAQRVLSRYTAAIGSVSEQLKRDLTSHIGIPAERIDVLHNGVDFDRFSNSTANASLRNQLHFSPDDLVIGSVGRLAPVKNYPLLLRAVASLDHDRVRLLLVGDGPERSRLEELARSLGVETRVRFLGHREDIPDLLGIMDAFVLPSFSEGMSNTLLEAMASGVACIASNVGGNSEIVRHGLDGLLFASGDEAALHSALSRLVDDAGMRSGMAAAGRARVAGEFSMEAMVERYESMYRKALAFRRS